LSSAWENTNVGLHLLGSLNLPLTSVAILLLSMGIRRTDRTAAAVGMVVAVVGIIGTVLSTAGQFGGNALYLGLGVGAMERIASYRGSLWAIAAGIVVLLQGFARAPRTRARRPILVTIANRHRGTD